MLQVIWNGYVTMLPMSHVAVHQGPKYSTNDLPMFVYNLLKIV